MEELLYLDPTSAWASDTTSVAALAEKIARDSECRGRVLTSGPDGPQPHAKQVAQAA